MKTFAVMLFVDADSLEKANELALSGKGRLQSSQFPSVGAQAVNIFGAAGEALLNPKPVSTEERERRLAICNACEFLIDGKRCSKCGCAVKWKAMLEAWHCPVEKW